MTTLLQRANAITNPDTRRWMVPLVHECHEAMFKAIEIPNEKLAPEYQNKRTHSEKYGESDEGTEYVAYQPLHILVARLEREYAAANPPKSESAILKEITTARVENYAAQFDQNEGDQFAIEYDEDSERLYRNMVAFCSAAALVDKDDIDEANLFGE